MDIDAIRRYCLQFPHTTENVQWGIDLCFKVEGKLFAVMPLEPAPVALSFKCTPEKFAELCERPGIRPAPYMARAQWVSLEKLNTLPDSELRELLAESYRLVFERLPKKRQLELRRRTKSSNGERTRAAAGKKGKPTGKGKTRSAEAGRG